MIERSSGDGWLERRRRYRHLAYAALVVGVVAFVAANVAGYPVVGLGLYWLGILGFLAVRRWAPMALFDERDLAIERQASYDALRLAGLVFIVAVPGMTTLQAVSAYELPPRLEGAMWSVAALFVVFGVSYLARRHRP